MNNIQTKVFLLDTNIFIGAYRRYYALDICPGFWEWLLYHNNQGSLMSIDKVKEEIKRGADALWQWVDVETTDSMFTPSNELNVRQKFDQINIWVSKNTQFTDDAKSTFNEVADGWLIAYAAVHNMTLITEEVYHRNVTSRVLIPNVCKNFHVGCQDTFWMLRELKAQFNWTP